MSQGSDYVTCRAWNIVRNKVGLVTNGRINTQRLAELARWPRWRWLGVSGCGVKSAPIAARIARLAWRVNQANLVSSKASDLLEKLSSNMPQLIGTMEGSSVLPSSYRPEVSYRYLPATE